MKPATRLKKTALIASIGILSCIGAIAAFLTSRDIAYNLFTVGDVHLEIEETFEEGQILSAGQMIAKQPWIRNTGTVNALFFAEVCVPVMPVTLVDADGSQIVPKGKTNPQSAADYRQEAEIYHLASDGDASRTVPHDPPDSRYGTFSYHAASDTTKGWYFLEEGTPFTVSDTHPVQGFANGTYHTYLFGYNAWVAPEDTTVPIFDTLQLRSMVDGSIEGESVGQVTIRAHALQANELNRPELTGNGDTTLYSIDDLASLHTICVNKEAAAQGGN